MQWYFIDFGWHIFKLPSISDINIAVAQMFELEGILLPLKIEFWNLVW